MVVALIAAAAVALLVGVAVGWALRGPLRWCPRDGEPLRCLTCNPLPAIGRAARGYGRRAV
jgi:hypothetical protein